MNQNLESFVGEEEQFDDVTMLVIKNQDHKLHLSYDKKDYEIIPEIVDRFNDAFAYLPEEVKGSTGIIIDELVNNLVSYEKREDLKIGADFKIENDELVIVISSNGDDYDPFKNHKKKYAEGFDMEMNEGGFGLSLIKNFAKEWSYKYEDHHSYVTIIIAIKK